MSKPAAFHDLPADHYPFTIEFIREDNGEVTETIEVAEGPVVIEIPGGYYDKYGCKAEVRITFATGEVVDTRDP